MSFAMAVLSPPGMISPSTAKLGRGADFQRFDIQTAQTGGMLREVALKGQHTHSGQ